MKQTADIHPQAVQTVYVSHVTMDTQLSGPIIQPHLQIPNSAFLVPHLAIQWGLSEHKNLNAGVQLT